MKQFSEASEQNKQPILEVLQQVFAEPGLVVEIGSGTGQHAAWFPVKLPHLVWQPTDLKETLPSVSAWIEEADEDNIRTPLPLDVNQAEWPLERADYVFSANTTHIMSWSSVVAFVEGVGRILRPGGAFCLYGPFNYNGHFTSVSNLRFDHWLRNRDPDSGIRDFAHLDELANANGLVLQNDFEMPVNNRILHWRKEG